MSSHHDTHHTEEKKPVSFSTPMILGIVTLLAIVLLVSTCDNKHGCCEDESACETTEAQHGGKHNAHATESHAAEHATVTTDTPAEDELDFLENGEEALELDSITH